MSIFSQLKSRKLLLTTLLISFLFHLLILKIIGINSNKYGNGFSLKFKSQKISVNLKTVNTAKTTKIKKTVAKKSSKNKKKTVKQPERKKERKKHTKKKTKKESMDKKVKIAKKTEVSEKYTNKQNTRTEKKPQKLPYTPPQNSIKNKESENPPAGGNIFSFLNWEKYYIKEVISSIEKNKNYPEIAKEMGIEGKVKLQVTVNRNGKLLNVKILESSGFPILDKNALETAKKSKLPPFPEKVKKEKININLYIIYKINSKD